MKPKYFALITVFLALLNACDRFYGATRVVDLEQMPQVDCVVSTLNSLAGVTNVSHSIEEGNRALTLHGLEKANIVHRYRYQYQDISNSFFIEVSPSGKVVMDQSYGCLNCEPPKEIVDKMQPFFLKVEDALAKRCGVTGQIR